MHNEENLKKIMYALTIKSRDPKLREKWIATGFRKINSKPGTLFNYWKKKLDLSDPAVIELAQKTWDEYCIAVQNPQAKPTSAMAEIERALSNGDSSLLDMFDGSEEIDPP